MSYFEQTKSGESRWWSWIAVTCLAFVSWVFFQVLLFRLPPLHDPIREAMANTGLSPESVDSTAFADALTQIMGTSPAAFALFLLTFPAGLIALYMGQSKIHKRSILALHTAAAKFRWIRVLQGFFLTWIVLGAFSLVANTLGIIEVQYIFAGGKFWIFALISLLFIPFQSATEEIVFRGYFNQGLTHVFKSKWIAFAITSLAFMALHLSNPEALEGAASGSLAIVMSGYFFFGFAMCLIVWIDDGLETAIGIHAGNNCFAAIIMNYENSVLPTPSVFLTGTDPVKDSISTVLVLATLVAIIWFWRNGSKRRAL